MSGNGACLQRLAEALYCEVLKENQSEQSPQARQSSPRRGIGSRGLRSCLSWKDMVLVGAACYYNSHPLLTSGAVLVSCQCGKADPTCVSLKWPPELIRSETTAWALSPAGQQQALCSTCFLCMGIWVLHSCQSEAQVTAWLLLAVHPLRQPSFL